MGNLNDSPIQTGGTGTVADVRLLAAIENVQAHSFEYGFRQALERGAPIFGDPASGAFHLACIPPRLSDVVWYGDCTFDSALAFAALRRVLPGALLEVHEVQMPLAPGADVLHDPHVYVHSRAARISIDHSRFYRNLQQDRDGLAVITDTTNPIPYGIGWEQKLDRPKHFCEFEMDDRLCLLSFSVAPHLGPLSARLRETFLTGVGVDVRIQTGGRITEAYACSFTAIGAASGKISMLLNDDVHCLRLGASMRIRFSAVPCQREVAQAALLIGHGLSRGVDMEYTQEYLGRIASLGNPYMVQE